MPALKALNKLPVSFILLIKYFTSAAASFAIAATKYIATVAFAFVLTSHCFFQPKTV